MMKNILNRLFKTNNTEISFKGSMDLADMPVVTFYQGDKKIHFLLDTGSNNCIIDSNFLKTIDYNKIDCKTNLYGLEGNTQTADICIISMNYKDVEYKYPFVIQNMKNVFGKIKKETGVTINGLLGTKFFNEYKYVLDFDELIAYSKK